MQEINVTELKRMMDAGEDFQLIDIREAHEYDTGNLKGELIPLATILNSPEKISKSKKVVLHCRSGARSAAAITHLEKKYGFSNLYNLKGGIIAWADQIDPSISVQ